MPAVADALRRRPATHAAGLPARLCTAMLAAGSRGMLEMARLAYDSGSLAGDYLRAGLGLALTAGPAFAVPVGAVPASVLAGLAALFAVHGLRTAWRHLTAIECDGDGLVVRGPLTRRLAWSDLERMRLRYFSTRRDRERGWMQLALTGGGVTVRIDSTLAGFEGVVRRAAHAAAAGGLALSPATLRNLESLGISATSAP